MNIFDHLEDVIEEFFRKYKSQLLLENFYSR